MLGAKSLVRSLKISEKIEKFFKKIKKILIFFRICNGFVTLPVLKCKCNLKKDDKIKKLF
jgi:hypothetical protein